jgi:hypothetical protein
VSATARSGHRVLVWAALLAFIRVAVRAAGTLQTSRGELTNQNFASSFWSLSALAGGFT